MDSSMKHEDAVWVVSRDPLPETRWRLKKGCPFPIQSKMGVRSVAQAFGWELERAMHCDFSELDYVERRLPCGCKTHGDSGEHEPARKTRRAAGE